MTISQSETTQSTTPQSGGKSSTEAVELWNSPSSDYITAGQTAERARISSRVPTVASVESAGHETSIPQLAKSAVESEAPIPQLEVENSTVDTSTVSPDETDDADGTGSPFVDDGSDRGRVFTIQTALVHPVTALQIITPEAVDAATHRRGVSKAAWIVHDRDIHTAQSAARSAEPGVQAGDTKNPHVHIVEAHPNVTTVSAVAKAYGIEASYVRVAKGKKAFELCCQYLTHEHPHQLGHGKRLYERDEIHFHSFDLNEALDKLAEEQAAKASKGDSSAVDELVLRIQEEGLTLRQAKEADPLSFSKAYSRMEKARDVYLRTAPMPPQRTNYYFGGASRTGKSALARLFAEALARSLYPDLDADEAIYMVGRPSVAFQGYEGQPICIWDDYRPVSMIAALGGSRDSVWPALDLHPQRIQVNKKHGAVTLTNSINIITGIQSYRQFLDSLAGEYVDASGTMHTSEDKMQAYGRMPFVAEVTPEVVELYVNAGFADGTRALESYTAIGHMRASMRDVMSAISAVPDDQRDAVRSGIGDQMLGSMVRAHLSYQPDHAAVETDDAIAAIMSGVTVLDPSEIVVNPAKTILDRIAAHEAELLDEILPVRADLKTVPTDAWSGRDKDRYGTSLRRLKAWKTTYRELRTGLTEPAIRADLNAYLQPIVDGYSVTMGKPYGVLINDPHDVDDALGVYGVNSTTGFYVTGDPHSDAAPLTFEDLPAALRPGRFTNEQIDLTRWEARFRHRAPSSPVQAY